MPRDFTVILSGDATLRAGVLVRPGLPFNLTPAALGRLSHDKGGPLERAGVTPFRISIGRSGQPGNSRSIQVNQTDWEFLTNRAGRLPIEELKQPGAGVLYLNLGASPRAGIENFRRRLELAGADALGLVREFKIAENQSPFPRTAPGSRIAPSQTKVLVHARSPAKSANQQGCTWTIHNAYPIRLEASGSTGGAAPTDRVAFSYHYFHNVPTSASTAQTEEIVLVYTEIKWTWIE